MKLHEKKFPVTYWNPNGSLDVMELMLCGDMS